MLNISGINNGVVLDHIQAGKSMDIYHYLNLQDWTARLLSSKMQRATKWVARISSRSREA